MTTRRTFCLMGFGTLAASRMALAQSADQDDQDTLRPRGAPTGRVGAATRGFRDGAETGTLDLVAPPRGIGLTTSDRPTLYYLLSGGVSGPLRLTISMRGQARPLADKELLPPTSRLGAIDLGAYNVRLAPGQLYVWSVALRLDPKAPSRDLVASALLQYQPGDPAFENALRGASPEQQLMLLKPKNYWYDEVALAVRGFARDNGAALNELLRQAGLQAGASAAAR
jgi:Domain of Unknown Function (DUF928)